MAARWPNIFHVLVAYTRGGVILGHAVLVRTIPVAGEPEDGDDSPCPAARYYTTAVASSEI